jgi:hypothetical protein
MALRLSRPRCRRSLRSCSDPRGHVRVLTFASAKGVDESAYCLLEIQQSDGRRRLCKRLSVVVTLFVLRAVSVASACRHGIAIVARPSDVSSSFPSSPRYGRRTTRSSPSGPIRRSSDTSPPRRRCGPRTQKPTARGNKGGSDGGCSLGVPTPQGSRRSRSGASRRPYSMSSR